MAGFLGAWPHPEASLHHQCFHTRIRSHLITARVLQILEAYLFGHDTSVQPIAVEPEAKPIIMVSRALESQFPIFNHA